MNIKNFQSALTQGGVRTNLFIVEGKIGQNTSNKTRFLVQPASLPPRRDVCCWIRQRSSLPSWLARAVRQHQLVANVRD